MSMVNTNAWRVLPKTPKAIIGTGTTNGIRKANTMTTSSSPKMFPKSRTESERMRLRWLMISIGSINTARYGLGPRKCAKYFRAPCARMPWKL